MEKLEGLSKAELSTYLTSIKPGLLVDVAERYFESVPEISQSALGIFLTSVDPADPLYPKALIYQASLFSDVQPIQGLSLLHQALSISDSFNKIAFPIVKRIIVSHKSEECISLLEKIIRISSGFWQAKYLHVFAETQSNTEQIEIFNNIWEIIYEQNLSLKDIQDIISTENEFIPIAYPTSETKAKPDKVFDEKFVETWWACDGRENRCYVFLALLINDLRSTLQKSVTADLMGFIITLGLTNELGIKLAQAGIQFNIEPLENCFEIKISGHPSKILDATESIMEYLYNSSPTEETIEIAMNMLKSQYQSMTADPANQTRQLRLAFLQHHQYLYPNKLQYLKDFLQTELNLANVKILMFVSGNVDNIHVVGTSEFIEGLLSASEGKKLKYLTPRTVTLLPEQIVVLQQNSENDDYDESVIEVYFQFGQASVEERVMTSLLEAILTTSIYDPLINFGCKTVQISSRMTRGISGVLVKVTSIDVHPNIIQQKIFECVEGVIVSISSLFSGKKSELIEIKSQGFKSFSDKSSFYWDEILQGNFEFEREKKEIDYLVNLDYEVFTEWVQKSKLVSKALVIKVLSKNLGIIKDHITEEFIQDTENFRNHFPCYSWLRIMH
ncbi:hypothetical protein SteCoe_17759 [Stentor coeruleus]|uniref:Peptidase M16 middle/third domain-containing protein n=1 Tax=Stentor coeruleus TaxID=5963 RepID=A0A1R2BY76_9CILI|nr:hypothetical protein SteCoe_17759 [Stentor coeruleus]